MFLLGDQFTADQKKRDFDFYDPLTTGDSSLSSAIQAIMASEMGYREKANEYMRHAVLMDLADVAGNATDGCHIACMGGTWRAVVYGLAGLRDYGRRLSFRPLKLLRPLRARFRLTIRGQQMEVEITQDAVTYSLRKGERLTVRHNDEEIELIPGERTIRAF